LGCVVLWGRGLCIGIVVSVVIDCEPRNLVVRREIRANHKKSAPLWIHNINSGVASFVESLSETNNLGLSGTYFLCSHLVDYFPIKISILGCVMKYKVIVLSSLYIIVYSLCNYVLMILIYIFLVEIIIKLHAYVKFEMDG